MSLTTEEVEIMTAAIMWKRIKIHIGQEISHLKGEKVAE